MVIASEFGTGQVLWSFLWFFLFFMWFWLVISIFSDIIRSRDLSGWGKALWSIAIIFVPFLGVFMYLIVNGDKMNGRAMDDAQAADAARKSYIQNVAAGGSDPAEEFSKLAELHSAGSISDAEYAQAKAKIIG